MSNAAIPYFPFVEAFNSFTSTEGTSIGNDNQSTKLKRWLTIPSDTISQNISPQAWKDQTFESITQELFLLSAQKPVVVFVDDLHWADSASLSLFQYLSRSITDERILLIATFRSEEINPITKHDQPFPETLRIMRRDDLYNEIKLTGLGQTEICEIAKSMLGDTPSQKLIKQLAKETAGNPLFVIESLKMLAEQKELIQEEGEWTTKEEHYGIPDKVKDVILRRLSNLTPEARDVLDVGSVIGDQFDAQLIGAVLNQSVVKVLSILNSISKSKSLLSCPQDVFLFDHPKTREVLYEEISIPLRKEYHLRVANELKKQKLTDSRSNDLAYHYINGGDQQNAVKFSIEAGKNALASFSNAEAIKHFTYVLNSIENQDSPTERTTALEGLGDAYYASTMLGEAGKTYKKLAGLGGQSKVRALRKAMECAFFQSAFSELDALLREVEEIEITDPLEKARILMNKARAENSADLRRKIKFFEEGVRLAEQQYSPWDVAWILIGLGSTRAWTGQIQNVIGELLRAAEIFRELKDIRWLIEAYNAVGHTFTTHIGLRKEAIEYLKKAADTDYQAKVEDYIRLAQINASWARAIASENDLQEAIEKSLEAKRYAEKTDSGWARGVAYSNLTILYNFVGENRKAKEYFTKLMALPGGAQRNSYVGTSAAKACFMASQGKNIEAGLIFEGIFQALKTIDAKGVEANARLTYAGVLETQGLKKNAIRQKQIAQDIYEKINAQLEKGKVHAYLMAPVNVSTDQEFEIRLDLINVSKNPVVLNNIETIISPGLQIRSAPTSLVTKRNIIELNNQELEKFSVKTVKLIIQASKLGVHSLNQQISYTDNFGTKKLESTQVIQIHAKEAQMQLASENMSTKTVSFKSQTAEDIYGFLVKSFKEDFQQRRMPKDRSGWRSLMDIVRGAKVSRYAVYGFPSSQGQAIAELQRAGLVEVRIFEGERGRGGKIVKVRKTENAD